MLRRMPAIWLLGCGAEVLGVGNGGNRFYSDSVIDELAGALAKHESEPRRRRVAKPLGGWRRPVLDAL